MDQLMGSGQGLPLDGQEEALQAICRQYGVAQLASTIRIGFTGRFHGPERYRGPLHADARFTGSRV